MISITGVIALTIFEFTAELSNNLFPFHKTEYMENFMSITSYGYQELYWEERRVRISKNFTDLKKDDIYLFMNNENMVTIYHFNGDNLDPLYSIKCDNKDLKITKYNFQDSIRITVEYDGKKIEDFLYIKKINKLISFKK